MNIDGRRVIREAFLEEENYIENSTESFEG